MWTFAFIVFFVCSCVNICCPAAELENQHGGMCLLVAQTMASELRVGGGPRRFFSMLLTFSLK